MSQFATAAHVEQQGKRGAESPLQCVTVKRLLRSVDCPAPAFVGIVTRTHESRRAAGCGGVKIATEQAEERPAPNAVQEIAK